MVFLPESKRRELINNGINPNLYLKNRTGDNLPIGNGTRGGLEANKAIKTGIPLFESRLGFYTNQFIDGLTSYDIELARRGFSGIETTISQEIEALAEAALTRFMSSF